MSNIHPCSCQLQTAQHRKWQAVQALSDCMQRKRRWCCFWRLCSRYDTVIGTLQSSMLMYLKHRCAAHRKPL